MGIRDNEIQRLTQYAKGLGLQVTFTKKISSDAGAWVTDGSQIFISQSGSKIYTILTLIHELSHHLYHIHSKDRQIDEELDQALENDEFKYQRHKIYMFEIASYQWFETIYKETNMRFNISILHAERDVDIWVYKTFRDKGKFPTKKEIRLKRIEFRKSYGLSR